MTDTNWRRNPAWFGAELDDGVVMLDVEGGKYFGLNKSATAIWDALQQPMTEPAIVDHLRSRFEVSQEACAEATARTLVRLEEIGAVERA